MVPNVSRARTDRSKNSQELTCRLVVGGNSIGEMAEAEAPMDEGSMDGQKMEAMSPTKEDLSPKRTKSSLTGYVGASPSSLAAMAKGRSYFVDPYTPFTPRPDVRKHKRADFREGYWHCSQEESEPHECLRALTHEP